MSVYDTCQFAKLPSEIPLMSGKILWMIKLFGVRQCIITECLLIQHFRKSTDWQKLWLIGSVIQVLSLCLYISGILEPLVHVWSVTIFPGWWINRDSCVRSIQTSCSRSVAGLKSGFESASINSAITAGTAAPWTETILFLGESYSAVSTRNVSVCFEKEGVHVIIIANEEKKKWNKNAKS